MAEPSAFDAFAADYDQWFERHPEAYALELKAIKALLPPGGKGVEVGAGSGRFAQPLGVDLGVEPSAAMREIAARRGVRVVDGTAEALPLADASYDYALLLTTVCFLDSPQRAFREIHRVLTDDGSLIVGFIDKNSPLGQQYEQKKRHSRFYQNAHFHSFAALQQDLIAAGFGPPVVVQTLIPGDAGNHYAPLVKPGAGEGSFVVLRAQKQYANTQTVGATQQENNP